MDSNANQSFLLFVLAALCLIAANWCIQSAVQAHLLEMSTLIIGIAARHFVGDLPRNPTNPGSVPGQKG